MNVDDVLADLTTQGFSIIEAFLPPDTIHGLFECGHTQLASGRMKKAGTGKTAAADSASSIRGDYIHWLDEASHNQAEIAYWQAASALQATMNRELFMGLNALEAHYAIYPPGTGYQRHLDQFQGDTSRQLSSVLYLNQAWQPSYGGQLRLYLDHDQFIDITPLGGRMVVFLSAKFEHEVLPASRERTSLTGWFKVRDNQPI